MKLLGWVLLSPAIVLFVGWIGVQIFTEEGRWWFVHGTLPIFGYLAFLVATLMGLALLTNGHL